MNIKKRKRFLVQIILFIVASLMIFFTYYNNDSKISSKSLSQKNIETDKDDTGLKVGEETKKDEEFNYFENVEYNGIDLNGNRYVVKSKSAKFKSDFPELIKMTSMTAIFYFKDNTTLKIFGNYGSYNNKTFDMEFREEILAEYNDNFMYADNLNYLNDKSFLEIFGNVKLENNDGEVVSDRIELDLKTKKAKFSMLNDNTVRAKVK
tara:strand:+ start:78 stop:698 length:621 start_codon:yes stop_codon:yes gene_type:complete